MKTGLAQRLGNMASKKNSLVTSMSAALISATALVYTPPTQAESSVTNSKGYVFPVKSKAQSRPIPKQQFRAAVGSGLRVDIYRDGSGFELDVDNLNIGTTYGVLGKNTLENDPFSNNWTIVDSFVAESQGIFYPQNAFSAPSRWYAAANLDAYSGPSLNIVSLRPNALVGGDVPLKLEVNDLLPSSTIEVHVNDTIVSRIESGTPNFIIPSYLFPNGANQVYIRAVNTGVRVGDDILAFEQWTQIPLVFSNQVSLNNYQFQFTPRGATTLDFKVNMPVSYNFQVKDLEGTLLYSRDGTSLPDGSMPIQYNFTKNDGSSLGIGAYVFEVDWQPREQFAAAAVAHKVRMTNVIDAGVTMGETIFVSHQWPNRDVSKATQDNMFALTSFFSFAANGSPEIVGYTRDPYQGVGGNIYFPANTGNAGAKATLDAALSYPFSGAFVYQGHAGGDGIIDGADNFMQTLYLTRDMARALENTRGFATNGMGYWWLLKKRLHENTIMGCSSSAGSWAEAGGLVPGVNQLRNRDMDHNMFTGFKNLAYNNDVGDNYTWNIHAGWMIPDYDWTIASSINNALLLNQEIRDWGPVLYGDPLLTWANQYGFGQ